MIVLISLIRSFGIIVTFSLIIKNQITNHIIISCVFDVIYFLLKIIQNLYSHLKKIYLIRSIGCHSILNVCLNLDIISLLVKGIHFTYIIAVIMENDLK